MAEDFGFRRGTPMSRRAAQPRPVRPVVVPARVPVAPSQSLTTTINSSKVMMDVIAPRAAIRQPVAKPAPAAVSTTKSIRKPQLAAPAHSAPRLVETPKEHTNNKKSAKRSRRSLRYKLISAATYSLAALAILVGGLLTWQTLQTNAATKAQVNQIKLDSEAIVPGAGSATGAASKKPAAPYTVAPDLPKFLSIPKLGFNNVEIVQVGLTKAGAIGAPLTAWQVAWYNGSAKPGASSGAMFIDGHVEASQQHPGTGSIFSKLNTLVAGDTLTLTQGNNTKYTFKVVKTAEVPVNNIDMNTMLTSAVPGKLGLNLMTCAGTYQNNTDSFDHRTEVFAVQE